MIENKSRHAASLSLAANRMLRSLSLSDSIFLSARYRADFRQSNCLIRRKVDEKVRKNEGEKEDAPAGPNDADRHDEGEEDGNHAALLHGGGERLTGGDEGKVQCGRLGFLAERRRGQPLLRALQIVAWDGVHK